jgi:hypothetical protein
MLDLKKQFGLATMRIGAGQEIATIFEAIELSVVGGSQRGEARSELF